MIVSYFWVKNNKLCVLACVRGFKEFKYAFYLYVGGVKFSTKWYGDLPYCEFPLEQNAVDCKVKVFAKNKDTDDKLTCYAKQMHLLGSIEDEVFHIGFPKEISFFDVKVASACGYNLNYLSLTNSAHLNELIKNHKVKVDDGLDFISGVDSLVGFDGVSVSVQFGDECVDLPWSNSRLSLGILKTENISQFMRFFTYASKRHYSSEVAWVVAINNLSGNVPEIIKVNSSVVFSYKSIELGRDISKCLVFLNDSYSMINEMAPSFGVRSDPVQLFFSVSMAEIHLLILLRKEREILDNIERQCDVFDSSPYRGYYTINYSKSLAFGILLAVKFGDLDRASVYIKRLLSLEAFMNCWFDQGNEGWLASERKYVDDLILYFKDHCYSDLVMQGYRERIVNDVSRVKSEYYLSRAVDFIC